MMRLGVPRSILCILALMVSLLAVQNSAAEFFFVQLADMQFGMFASDRDFTQETVNYEFVVANINRIRPRFVVICGDLINKVGDAAQTAEYLRITAKIDPSIPVYAVPGNQDVGNGPHLKPSPIIDNTLGRTITVSCREAFTESCSTPE